MKILTPVNFEKYISQIEEIPILILFGEERFFHEQVLKIIENHIFKTKSEKNLNCHVFYGTENNESDILSACFSYPMLADHKLVIVREFDKLKMYDRDSFLKYIDNPQPSTILVLSAEKWGDSDFHHKIKKNSISVKCIPLYENQLFNWVSKKFLVYNIVVGKDIIRFLIENIGQNLLNLNSEIEKIINYVGSGNTVEIHNIAQLTGFSREVNIFNFQKVLAAKNLSASLRIGLRLLEQGEAPTGMIIQLMRHVVNLMKINENIRRGKKTTNELMKVTGLPYYFLTNMMKQSKNFTTEQYRNSFNYLAKADLHLKTGYQTPGLVMELLLYRLIKD